MEIEELIGIIESSKPKYEMVDDNNAIITDQYITLTTDTYNDIKKKLHLLDLINAYCYVRIIAEPANKEDEEILSNYVNGVEDEL